MCGIVCYIGRQPALPILVEGLKRLEYRGYDSSGLAIHNGSEVQLVRELGPIRNLERKLGSSQWSGTSGIAHTRWATHGAPSEENAHPHGDCRGEIYVAHNGIIENYRELKSDLERRGHCFRSQTDTEVLAHLIEEFQDSSLEEATQQALERVIGTYGLAILSRKFPDKLVVARRGSPIILGIGAGETLAASDVSALLRHTRKVIYLQDGEIAVLEQDRFRILSHQQKWIRRSPETVEWDSEAAEMQGYPHFMLKEIHEQPEAIQNAMRGRLLWEEGTAKLGGLEAVADRLRQARHMIIVSCGSSYFAGLLGRYVLERLTSLSVEVELASEFRYRKLNFRKGTVVLAISQSGETADTLAAIREAKRKGALVLGLVNVVGSTLTRETDAGVYNHAGPEIGVASTKTFISQMVILHLIALFLGRQQEVPIAEGQRIQEGLQKLPDQVRHILSRQDRISDLARRYCGYHHFFYLGRKYNYPVALEGALKLKEIAYLHAEGYAAGEMKHGPLALIDEEFPSVCIVPRDSSYEKMVSNVQEIKARRGKVIALTSEQDGDICSLADEVFPLPSNLEILTPILAVVPLQLFAYYAALHRGCEIDRPRNLAKSVTVE
ncbi:MAG: glutamine--fructose-6-phosphate transaminase (isomerizing) [Acidobacteria bacterium]|nr:glutamine--fructose-6-phosphate transaminase (isomerizing) [Acidobacteriota bacterium]